MVQRFLDDNHIPNFTILPVGLSNTDRFTKILSGETDYGAIASIVEGFRPDSFYSSCRYVCLRKGDDVISELEADSLCAIKVDVEGAELEVFEGLLTTIKKTMPFLIFEVLNDFLVITGRKLDDETVRFRQLRIEKLESLLRRQGYEIFTILEAGTRLKNLGKITTVVSDDLSLTNYFAAPRSAVDGFLKIFQSQALQDRRLTH
jgi:FkbM family methyltransferase